VTAPRLIGLSGVAGAGKDAVADILVREHRACKIALADPMKRFCAVLFDFSYEQLWGESASRNVPDDRWDGLTPRRALQTLGTEWGRGCHPDVWIRAALRMASAVLDAGAEYSRGRGVREAGRPTTWRRVVIPDVRFRNELDAIRAAGGEVWRIIRPGAGLTGAAAAHLSENELTDDMPATYDMKIVNAGTLEDLAITLRRAPT
jgi:hypothetical protein